MQGLLDRVGALGGTLAVESPPGEGTRVVGDDPAHGAGGGRGGRAAQRERDASCPMEEAERIQGERRRRLAFRLGSLGIVAAVLVAIWALTDPGLPWIAWPLLALALDRRPRRLARVLDASAQRGRSRRGRPTEATSSRASRGAAGCATTSAPT